jgi:hypothetical protein
MAWWCDRPDSGLAWRRTSLRILLLLVFVLVIELWPSLGKVHSGGRTEVNEDHDGNVQL